MAEEPRKCIEHGQDIAVLKSEMIKVNQIIIRIDEKLDRILEQTTKHNGRMDKIESDVERNFTCDEETKHKADTAIKGIETIQYTIQHAKGYGKGVILVASILSGSVGFLTGVALLISKLKGI